ncbi:Porphobilinogen synthase, partial [hydrothermal vent metagenome]
MWFLFLTSIMATFPLTRKRRLRGTHLVRQLVAENHLTAQDLILPVFVLAGQNQIQAIKSMPGVYRLSIDLLLDKLIKLHKLGLHAVALFPVITADKKTEFAEEAFNDDGLVPTAIKLIKSE